MKSKITFAPLVMTCLLLSACGHNQNGKTSTATDISLGVFPASRDVAKNIPVEKYHEIIITKEAATGNQKNGQRVSPVTTGLYRVGLQAVATPVFNADGTSRMVLKGTFSCISGQYSLSSEPHVSIHLTRTYSFAQELKASPGDWLAVRTENCSTETKKLPVMLVVEKR